MFLTCFCEDFDLCKGIYLKSLHIKENLLEPCQNNSGTQEHLLGLELESFCLLFLSVHLLHFPPPQSRFLSFSVHLADRRLLGTIQLLSLYLEETILSLLACSHSRYLQRLDQISSPCPVSFDQGDPVTSTDVAR